MANTPRSGRDAPETANRLIGLARQIGEHWTQSDALRAAQERGWVDPAGLPTADGYALVTALSEQASTRTVFRNM